MSTAPQLGTQAGWDRLSKEIDAIDDAEGKYVYGLTTVTVPLIVFTCHRLAQDGFNSWLLTALVCWAGSALFGLTNRLLELLKNKETFVARFIEQLRRSFIEYIGGEDIVKDCPLIFGTIDEVTNEVKSSAERKGKMAHSCFRFQIRLLIVGTVAAACWLIQTI